VAAGTYYENITLRGGVVLLGGWSADFALRDPDGFETTIDGSQAGNVVTALGASIGGSTVIDGFVITNGYSSYGGGIYCDTGASPTISHNRVEANVSTSQGGGIFLVESHASVVENRIIGNITSPGYYGGGIYCRWCGANAPLISGNVIMYTRIASGLRSAPPGEQLYPNCAGIFLDASDPVITGNLIAQNQSSGTGRNDGILVWAGSNPTIAGNTIVANDYGVRSSWGSAPDVENNIIVLHSGAGIFRNSDSGMGRIACNDVWGNGVDYSSCSPGSGDFSEDPLFCDPEGDDFWLQACSPCIDGYGCGQVGAYGVGCACQDVATVPTTWGDIKAEFWKRKD
jgi:parallel beta-helix repeat protein